MNQDSITGISFPFRFNKNGGVAKSTTTPNNFKHLEEGIRQVLLTKISERVIELGFGTDIDTNLFESVEDISNLSILKHYINKGITEYDNRVEVVDIDFETNESTIIAIIYVYVEKYLSSFKMTVDFSRRGGY